MRTAIFPARLDQLESIREFITQAARDASMDDSDIYAVEMATDEACSNIVEHAYQGVKDGDIECTCDSDEDSLTVILRDHGRPFDPSAVPEPDLDTDLADRKVGGLGIFLMKNLMDDVHFDPLGESGNVLTMVKRRKRTAQAGDEKEALSPWRQIIALGEELLRKNSLAAQRDLVLEAAVHLLGGQAGLWLDESLFHLPGLNQLSLFPPQPPTETMQRAFKTGAAYSPKGQKTLLAVPLKSGSMVLGALQMERPDSPFRKKDLELLDGLAGHVSLALATSRRLDVEQWRIEQLTLVRRVSAQIANVLDLKELTRRVTKLIQRTFKYYYVAVFTCEPGQAMLTFRSSAGQAPRLRSGQARGRGKSLKISLGEGLIGSAAQTGKEVITNDVHLEPRFRFIDSLPETQSEAVLPLKIEGKILGVLDVQSDHLGAFHPNDLLVLRALADTIAIAINGARLYGDLQKRARQLEMVVEVSDDIASTLDLDELLNKVALLIRDRLGFPYVHLFTVHPNRRQIIYEAGSGRRSDAHKDYVLGLDDPGGVIPWVARNAETVLANDVTQEPRYRHSPIPPEDTRAEMTVPLIFDKQVVGVLDVQSDKINAFSEDDLFLCQALADGVAVAIHNAELYRTERWRRQVADSLHEVAGLVSANVGVEDVVGAILLELERSLPCDVAAIWLLDGEQLYLAHIRGADMLEVETAARNWPEAYNFLQAALDSVEPVIRKPDDPIRPSGAARGFSADYSSIAAALRTGERPLGVLTLTHHASGRYGHEAQAITATFASYAAVAIENARLYDSAQEQAYASAALLQVAQAVVNSTNLDETLETVARIMPILVGVRGCIIYLLEAEQFHSAKTYGISDDIRFLLLNRDFSPGEFTLLDAVRERSQMVIGLLDPECTDDCLDPALAITQEEIQYALQASERMLIGFPLMLKNDFYGVLLVEETPETRRFRSKRVEIITGVAQQVVLSIQNERLQREMVVRERLEHEFQLARQIQQTFLPEHLPELPGWDLAFTWRTARQVGGDFYDVIELPGKRLGLFIADVSDKGMPAAIFMALTRTLFRAVIKDTPSPAEVMRRVNALILPDNRESMFVTAVYGVVDLESGEFTYANAGHNPPVWFCRNNSALKLLRRTGAALGILDDLLMEERTLRFDPGDLLLFYTDGLTEAFSPEDETYSEERLMDALASAGEYSARGLLDKIEASVDQFTGPVPASDDLTMLVLKRMD